MQVKKFVFGPFAENTYIIHENEEALIIDPGCSNEEEEQQISQYLNEQSLQPVRLINTHCHIDHILGNQFVADTYDLQPECHEKELEILKHAGDMAGALGINYKGSPQPGRYLKEGDTITVGNTELKVLFTPGHSPGHIALLTSDKKTVVSADVIFQSSIGRTDLPGGDYATLIHSIKEQILTLPDECVIWPGHGPETSVGFERKSNPFVLAEM